MIGPDFPSVPWADLRHFNATSSLYNTICICGSDVLIPFNDPYLPHKNPCFSPVKHDPMLVRPDIVKGRIVSEKNWPFLIRRSYHPVGKPEDGRPAVCPFRISIHPAHSTALHCTAAARHVAWEWERGRRVPHYWAFVRSVGKQLSLDRTLRVYYGFGVTRRMCLDGRGATYGIWGVGYGSLWMGK